MSLIPNTFKFKKHFKGKIRTNKKNSNLVIGNFGLKALESGRLTPKQLEGVRRLIKKIIKPANGIVRSSVHAYTPVTSKGIAARQGRGKGKVSVHVCSVQAGTFLFEVLCTDRARVISAFRIGSFLLPIKTTLVERSII